MYRADTIVACATPAGRGAIAIVRLSGPDCAAIAEQIFLPHHPGPLRGWRMRHGTVVHAEPIDDALAVFFPAPHTYTGEDMLELHCHGSPLIVEQIIVAAIACGARAADHGEFSRRAVLNGRIDLLQAEAVADLIEARMSSGARAAWAQLQGALSDRLSQIRAAILAVLADIEAHVDFSDDELPEESGQGRTTALGAVCSAITDLLGGFEAGRRQREGLRVVVTGLPNAGKSSLINRLLGCGRMIVTDEPGTTRDVVEETVDLGGLAFVLTDTAGIRVSDSAAETAAVARARRAADEADLVLYVVDGSVPASALDAQQMADLAAKSVVLARNKADLSPAAANLALAGSPLATIAVSARTGMGVDALIDTLIRVGKSITEGQPAGISRVRHRTALERALVHLEAATAVGAAEPTAFELRAALHEIASLSFPVDTEDVLDVIFRDFCIGK